MKSEKKIDTISKFNNKSINKHKERIAILGLVFVVSTSAGFAGGYFGAINKTSSVSTKEIQQQIVNNESNLISDIAKDVGPSVVSVNVVSEETANTFYGAQNYSQRSAGTGVIIDSEGIIITNRHVVPKNATSVSVTLSDGTELKDVKIIGQTNENDPLDIAFLKIEDKKGKGLKAAKIGNSSEVQVGDKVVAIGNALGQFENTVTSGIISGYGRDLSAGNSEGSETLQNLFQTDAAINQGNSGGPLVNSKGEVIGINTAIAGGDAQNIGFAIPITDVSGLIKSVLEKGKLERPYLGVSYINLNDDYAYHYNLDTKRGAYLAPLQSSSPVQKNSPAEKAGLKEKDIIVKVNDTDINEKNGLSSVLGRYSVGDQIKLTVIRDGNTISLEAKLEVYPE